MGGKMEDFELIKPAIEELSEYRKAKGRLKYIQEQIGTLRAKMVLGSHSDNLGVQGGNTSKDDMLVNLLQKIDDLEKRYTDGELECMQTACRIESEINKLKYPQCEVLRKYYCENKSIDRIALDMNYSYDGIKRIKQRAVRQYAKNMRVGEDYNNFETFEDFQKCTPKYP